MTQQTRRPSGRRELSSDDGVPDVGTTDARSPRPVGTRNVIFAAAPAWIAAVPVEAAEPS